MTPLAVSFTGVLSPSAIETVGVIALAVVTWSMLVGAEVPTSARVVWVVALAFAVLSRSIGLALGALAIVGATWCAGQGLKSLARRLGTWPLAAAAAIATAALLWDPLFKANLSPTVSLFDSSRAITDLNEVWRNTIDVSNHFGWLDTVMPLPLRGGIPLLAAWLLAASAMLSSRGWARRLTLLVVFYIVIGFVMSRGLQPTGFGMQARFLLPGVGAIVVVCGLRLVVEGPVAESAARLGLVFPLVALAYLTASLVVLRRHVVGASGPMWFWGDGVFRPPGGWVIYVPLAVAFVGWTLWLTFAFRGPRSLEITQVLAASVPQAGMGVAPSEPEPRQPIDDRPADVDPVREVVVTRSRFIERSSSPVTERSPG
jgi:hypothetical protein